MSFESASDEQLYRLAARGNQQVYNELVNRLFTCAKGIIYNVLTQNNIKGFDVKDAYCLAYQDILTTFSHYQYGRPIRVLFRTIFVRDLLKLIDKYQQECISMNPINLDSEISTRSTFHDIVGSNDEDPRKNYELNQLNLILSSPSRKKGKNSNQAAVLKLKKDGFTINEIAEKLKISVAQVRRLLEDDKEGTVLNEIKITLK